MPRLVIKTGVGVGRDHTLGTGACVVGRDVDADFLLEDPKTSRQHFRISQEAGVYYLQDLASTNGTRLNGKRLPPQPNVHYRLRDGDVVRVGVTEMHFVQKDLLSTLGTAPNRRGRRRR